MTLPLKAMTFAMERHKGHVRKYTGNPYADHLAEVAGIVSTVNCSPVTISTAWLHDCVEDVGVTGKEIYQTFGNEVWLGVMALSDMEQGNRAERKKASRLRLGKQNGWIQSIKVADLISNTSSIVAHDPKFAAVYLEEKALLLECLVNADRGLLQLAHNILNEARKVI